jgi:hypothetical protein
LILALNKWIKKYAAPNCNFEIIDNNEGDLESWIKTMGRRGRRTLRFCFLSLFDPHVNVDFSEAMRTKANVFLVMSSQRPSTNGKICHALTGNGFMCHAMIDRNQPICSPHLLTRLPRLAKYGQFSEVVRNQLKAERPVFMMPIASLIDVLLCHVTFSTEAMERQMEYEKRELQEQEGLIKSTGYLGLP